MSISISSAFDSGNIRVLSITDTASGPRAELEIEMRLAGISHMRDVAWGILEPNGKISFIRHDNKDSVQEDDDKPI